MLDISRRNLLSAGSAGSALLLGRTAFAQTPLNEAKPDPGMPPVFGPAPEVALLSRNENPLGPAPTAIRAIYDTASKGCYYADGGVRKLTDLIGERFSVAGDSIVIGSGSTEVLCAAALSLPMGKAILCPDLFWDTTVLYAQAKGVDVKRVPLDASMNIDLDAMSAAIGPDVGLVQICNPNNPTGVALDGDKLRAFIKSVDPSVTILIDEAYMELTDNPEYTSVTGLLKDHPNLIVTRTFSKIYGMAGMRVGYALMSPANAETVRAYLMSFGGNTSGLAAAIASYNDKEFMTYSKTMIVDARGMIMDAVKKAGLSALPSQTNFVYVKVPDADMVKAKMEERGIMIRPAYGKWKQWSRVSTGKIEDVKRYAEALPEVVGA